MENTTTTTNIIIHNDNNDNNEYANQTIYNTFFSPPDDRFTASSRTVIAEHGKIPDIANFAKFLKKTELLDKRGFELTEKRKADSCPPANPHS